MSDSSTFAKDFSQNVDDDDTRHEAEFQMQDRMHDSITFHAEMMGDIMCFCQALKQSDTCMFVQAVVKEVNEHVDRKHWVMLG